VVRVPGTLYRKRYHAGNTHTVWPTWDRSRQARAWRVHCRDMLRVALETVAGPVERRLLLLAAAIRLVQGHEAAFPFAWLRTRSAEEKRAEICSFVAEEWERAGSAELGFRSVQEEASAIARELVGEGERGRLR